MNDPMQALAIKPFITGAAGFIGGRIAERLWLDYKIKATCLVQSYTNASRLARLPVTIIPGDVLNKEILEQAMDGCDVVFHCAFGNTEDPVLNSRINEVGLRNLGDIALKLGVRRFIHFSTIAVYGSRPPEFVDEETPVAYSGDEYGNSKIRTELIAKDLLREGLSIVVIRPTIVFGPFSPIWTIGTVKRILSGGWEDTDAAPGICNPVYIDDLVTALFLCVAKEKAIGETFIISGNDPIPWNDFFADYRKMAGRSHETAHAGFSLDKIGFFRSTAHASVSFLRRFFEPQLLQAYETLKIKNPALAEKLHRLVRGGPDKNEKDRFSQKTIYSIEKAKQMLGYEPRSFAEGMKPTERWLRHHEFIPIKRYDGR